MLTFFRLAQDAIRLRRLVRGLDVLSESNGTVTLSTVEWYELVEAASPERATYHALLKDALARPAGSRASPEWFDRAREALKLPPPDEEDLAAVAKEAEEFEAARARIAALEDELAKVKEELAALKKDRP